MNFINRIIMIVLALALIVAPVALFLMILGILPASILQDAVGALGTLPGAVSAAGQIVGVAGILLALVALVLLLLELRMKLRPKVKHLYVQRDAGRETRLTDKGATSLVEGAAREAGALSPKVSLKRFKKSYRFSCKISAPASADLTGLAAGVRQNIQRVLEYQEISARSVEVLLQGVQEATQSSGGGASSQSEATSRDEAGAASLASQGSDRGAATAAS